MFLADFGNNPAQHGTAATPTNSTALWRYSFNLNYTMSTPGDYPLCFCGKGGLCLSASDFRVALGSVTVRGPENWSLNTTCGFGSPCRVSLPTHSTLQPTTHDRLAILESCGTTDANFLGGIDHNPANWTSNSSTVGLSATGRAIFVSQSEASMCRGPLFHPRRNMRSHVARDRHAASTSLAIM